MPFQPPSLLGMQTNHGPLDCTFLSLTPNNFCAARLVHIMARWDWSNPMMRPHHKEEIKRLIKGEPLPKSKLGLTLAVWFTGVAGVTCLWWDHKCKLLPLGEIKGTCSLDQLKMGDMLVFQSPNGIGDCHQRDEHWAVYMGTGDEIAQLAGKVPCFRSPCLDSFWRAFLAVLFSSSLQGGDPCLVVGIWQPTTDYCQLPAISGQMSTAMLTTAVRYLDSCPKKKDLHNRNLKAAFTYHMDTGGVRFTLLRQGAF